MVYLHGIEDDINLVNPTIKAWGHQWVWCILLLEFRMSKDELLKKFGYILI
jgi:hypothetical protein